MKVEVLKENLKSGLLMVEKSVGKNASLPALGNALLEAKDNFLQFTATDLETAIHWWVLAKVSEKGNVLVPVRFLLNLISYLPDEKITLESSSQDVRLLGKGIKTKIQGLNPDDFPLIPKINATTPVLLDVSSFSQGLSQIVDMASASQIKPELSGVFFSFNQKTLRVAATDSFRLAEKTITLPQPVSEDMTFILPQKSAKELISVLEGRDGNMTLSFSENQVLFECGMKNTDHLQFQITSRLIEGEYPRYQDIIPTSFKTQVILSRDELLTQVKTAGLFSGKTNEVKISLRPEAGELEVSARSADVGENTAVINVKASGEAKEISFNYKYLVDGLAQIKSTEVEFKVNKEDGPCILSPVGDVSYLYVVMPIKPI